jgi:hypothetical protein
MSDKQINVYVRFVGGRRADDARSPGDGARRAGTRARRVPADDARKGGLKKRAGVPK